MHKLSLKCTPIGKMQPDAGWSHRQAHLCVLLDGEFILQLERQPIGINHGINLLLIPISDANLRSIRRGSEENSDRLEPAEFPPNWGQSPA